jgi:hypothetical protein
MATIVDDCVVFAGQSNGQTFGNTVAFPGGWTADPDILIWAGVPAANAWAQYDPASNADPTVGGNYWGPEAEFARQWRLDSPRKLRIIKRCIGNTGIVNPSAGPNWSAYTGGVF